MAGAARQRRGTLLSAHHDRGPRRCLIMWVVHPPLHDIIVLQMLHRADFYLFAVKPHFRALPHSFHVYARTHSLAGSPEASPSLVFGGFFFRSAEWASKIGFKIFKFERFRENRNVSPGSSRCSMPNPNDDQEVPFCRVARS